MISFALAAALLAAPAAAKPAPAANAGVEAAQKAAESAAQAADSASKAATAASQAAESAAKAATSAAAAADRAAAAADKVAAAVEKPAAAPAAAAAAPAAAPAPAETPGPVWKGTLGLGTIFLTGNTETLTFTTNLGLERKDEHWIIGVKGYGAYGQTTTTPVGSTVSSNQVTALKAGASLRTDRRFTPIFSGYLQASLATDHVASIEARPLVKLGASIIWFDVKEGKLDKTSFKTDLGLSVGREYRFNYYPTPGRSTPSQVDIVAPHFGASYKYAVSKDIQFSNDLNLSPNVLNEVRVLFDDTAKLSARLTETINLGIGFTLTWDSIPAPGKKELDTATLISLEVAL